VESKFIKSYKHTLTADTHFSAQPDPTTLS
jgi:hypothetical protein